MGSEGLPTEFADVIARRFAVLGEPTRIRLLDHLMEHGEASVQELAESLGVPYANVSKHLNVLHTERVVGRRKEATRTFYCLGDETIRAICELVCGGLREQLRALAELVPDERALPGARTA